MTIEIRLIDRCKPKLLEVTDGTCGDGEIVLDKNEAFELCKVIIEFFGLKE